MRNDSNHEQEWRDWIKLTENKEAKSQTYTKSSQRYGELVCPAPYRFRPYDDYSERLVEAIREAARDHYIRFGPHTLRRY